MGTEPRERAGIPEHLIRAQLERILASEIFVKSERLTGFLRFVVQRSLEGHGATLKEQVLVSELYGRGPDFDTRADPVVRVDARRLRDKLREYYAENPHEAVLITLPKGTYVPVFETAPVGSATSGGQVAIAADFRPTAPVQASPLFRGRLRPWMVGAAALFMAGITAAVWLLKPRQQDFQTKLTPLTAYPGNEGQASLSPDGNFVAFACTAPEPAAQSDICVKAVGKEFLQRLTDTPSAEYWPAWSPDSSEILFGRGPGKSAPGFQEFGQEMGIFVVSLIGGPERRVSATGAIAKWAPDGRSVLIRDRLKEDEPFGIFQLDLNTSQRRRLTQPRSGAGDWLFEVSPDGRKLAFIRIERPGINDVYVLPLTGGDPRRLTDWNRGISGLAWMPSGAELIYTLEGRLWRISTRSGAPSRGSPIPDIPMQAAGVSISGPGSRQPVRIVIGHPQNPINLHRIDLTSSDDRGVLRTILPFAPATRFNSPGRFSPDGSKVMFVSNRASADTELWIANSDGSEPRQLTAFGSARGMLAGSWSADGKKIVFDAAIDGNNDVYVISADGERPLRLTNRPGLDVLGDWSKDGAWIYYSSEEPRPGPGSNLWRIRSDGASAAERITTTGGFDPHVSPDGQYLYYLDRAPLAGLGTVMRMAFHGGETKAVLTEVAPFLWCVTSTGIYFVRGTRPAWIHLYRFEDEKIVRVGMVDLRIPGLNVPGRITVSPDGRWALLNVSGPAEGDLMLLDNFR